MSSNPYLNAVDAKGMKVYSKSNTDDNGQFTNDARGHWMVNGAGIVTGANPRNPPHPNAPRPNRIKNDLLGDVEEYAEAIQASRGAAVKVGAKINPIDPQQFTSVWGGDHQVDFYPGRKNVVSDFNKYGGVYGKAAYIGDERVGDRTD